MLNARRRNYHNLPQELFQMNMKHDQHEHLNYYNQTLFRYFPRSLLDKPFEIVTRIDSNSDNFRC